MPTLRSVEARNRVQSTPLSAPAEPLGFASLDRALGQANTAIQDAIQRDQRVAAVRSLASLSDTYSRRFIEGARNVEPGAEGFSTRIMADYRRDAEELVSNAPPFLRASMEAQAATFGSGLLKDSLTFEYQERDRYRVEGLDATVGHMANRLMRPGVGTDELTAAIAAMESTFDSAGLKPTVLASAKQTAARTLTESFIRGIEDTDPGAAQAMLDSGAFDAILKPEDKISLRNAVEGTIDADLSRSIRLSELAERRAERAERRRRDQRAAELRVLSMTDDLDETELVHELEAGNIDLSDFNTLLTGLRTEDAGIDNPDALPWIERGVIDGTLGTDEIFRLRLEGALSNDTATRLMIRAQTLEDEGGRLATSAARTERANVEAALGGLKGPLAILNPADSERIVNATREFDDLVTAGTDPREAARQVIERYRVSGPAVDALPSPRFRVGARGRPDVQATRRRTAAALRDGTITREEAAAEFLLLERIEDIMEAQ